MRSLPTIVIPYYKLGFLDAALGSLAAQTLGGFKVLIGDDASPEDPRPVLEKYRSRLDLEYRRFETNLGGNSLTRHWDRCVRLTNSEWVWLFSDDDLAGAECMASFERTRAGTAGAFDVYRFNTQMIDGNGNGIRRHPPHPVMETVAEFALAKVLGDRFSFAVEYIFRREAYNRAGGFKEFPLAWCSDDASWISFARKTGFRTIEGPEVLWRKSELNLSAPKPEHVSRKLKAFQFYLTWLAGEFDGRDFQARLKAGITRQFPNQVQHWGGSPGMIEAIRFWYFFARFTGRLNLPLLKALLGAVPVENGKGLAPA